MKKCKSEKYKYGIGVESLSSRFPFIEENSSFKKDCLRVINLLNAELPMRSYEYIYKNGCCANLHCENGEEILKEIRKDFPDFVLSIYKGWSSSQAHLPCDYINVSFSERGLKKLFSLNLISHVIKKTWDDELEKAIRIKPSTRGGMK